MIALAMDGITSLSIRPLRLITGLGFILAVLSLLGVIWAFVEAVRGNTVDGWASTMCVVCLMSAAVHYGLSTYRPSEVDIAIPRNHKVSTLPEWPPLHVVSFTGDRYSVGIVEQIEDDNKYNIYDIEKTIIDILFYRNKVGIEETKEILINYLGRSDRDLNKLHEYAQKLRCEKILRTYLEVLI